MSHDNDGNSGEFQRKRLYPLFLELYGVRHKARIAFFIAMAALPALALYVFLWMGESFVPPGVIGP